MLPPSFVTFDCISTESSVIFVSCTNKTVANSGGVVQSPSTEHDPPSITIIPSVLGSKEGPEVPYLNVIGPTQHKLIVKPLLPHSPVSGNVVTS